VDCVDCWHRDGICLKALTFLNPNLERPMFPAKLLEQSAQLARRRIDKLSEVGQVDWRTNRAATTTPNAMGMTKHAGFTKIGRESDKITGVDGRALTITFDLCRKN
jgi:hypothetical protein